MSEQARAPEVAEHFESLEQQQHAARLGMWVFLGSETLLFAGLFGLYVGYRTMYPADFLEASHHNNNLIGTVNTVILISSSFAVAWAVHAIQSDRRRVAALSLGVTVVMGALFLMFKLVEYIEHFREGIYPGAYYRFEDMPTPGAQLFFTVYYFLTGLHALHVLGGMTVLAILIVPTLRGRYTARSHTPVENAALYWHLVDVIWIFLWPLLYLVG